jgi:hypothetical protein
MKIFLLLTLLFTQTPKVSWFDDFLGIKLHPGYSISLAYAGQVSIADLPGQGGAVLLSIPGTDPGVARLRLGEDPITGPPFNALNFSARKNLVYKTRVFLNRNSHFTATIGFVGFHDPLNVVALVFNDNGEGAAWGFQSVSEGRGVTVPTGFLHQPGVWFTVRIETEWGEIPKARVYFNDETEPRAQLSGEYVPAGGLCPEFQLWNVPLANAHSQPTMWIDYLSVEQDR